MIDAGALLRSALVRAVSLGTYGRDTTSMNVEEHIDKCDAAGTTLHKVTLPATEAGVALSDPDFMSTNYSTIYPGLDGCARAAKLRLLLE